MIWTSMSCERRQAQARAVSNGSGCIAQNNKSLLQAVYPFGPFETLACRQQRSKCQALTFLLG